MNRVTLHWIKAHVGHPGNEKADELAKKGAQNPSLVGEAPLTSKQACTAMVKSLFDQKWQHYWTGLPTCRQTKQWMPDINRAISREMLKSYDRNTYSCFVQLITGHNFLNRHESIVAGVEEEEDGLCRLCLEDEESSFHVFAECPALAARRLDIFGTHVLEDLQDWRPWKVLTFFQRVCPDLLASLPFEQNQKDDEDESSQVDNPTGVG